MWFYILKLFISAGIIVAVSELAKTNATMGGLIKSLPLISILSMCWVYVATQNTDTIAKLSLSTFWYVLPTLPMFLVLPLLLKYRINFYTSLTLSIAVMLLGYIVTTIILKRFGYSL